jgi:hypothetical protein
MREVGRRLISWIMTSGEVPERSCIVFGLDIPFSETRTPHFIAQRSTH